MGNEQTKEEELDIKLKQNFRRFHGLHAATDYINHSQYQIMKSDIIKYGDKSSGVYRDIEWEMKRHPGLVHWCGYVRYKQHDNFTDDDWDKLDKLSHVGLTATLGFDCAHYGDYPTCNGVTAKYRTHDYVLTKLKEMIDCITDEIIN